MEHGSFEDNEHLQVLQLHKSLGAYPADLGMATNQRMQYLECHGHPIDKEGEHEYHGNQALLNNSKYMVGRK